MMNAAFFLQKALLSWLQASPVLMAHLQGQGVYDHVPTGIKFPYITFGHSTAYAWNTDSDTGEEHSLVVQVWARSNGRKQVMELMALTEAAIDKQIESREPMLDIGGYHLVNMSLQSSQARHEDLHNGYCGQLRYRAVTEKI